MGLIAYLREIPFRHLLSCSCVFVVAGLGFRQIRRWYRLRHIPGPSGAGWSVWWQLSGALSGRYHERLGEAAREYGMSIFTSRCHTLRLSAMLCLLTQLS